MRVRDLAREVGRSNAEVVAKLQAAGIAVRTHASRIADEDVEKARALFAEATEGEGVATTGAGEQAGDSGSSTNPQSEIENPKSNAPAGPAEDAPSSALPPPTEEVRYVLTGKRSVACGGVVCVRGEAVSAAQYARLTERVRGFFEAA